MNKQLSDITKKAREWRISNNYTQKEIAKKLNKSPALISKFESGEVNSADLLLGYMNIGFRLGNLYKTSEETIERIYMLTSKYMKIARSQSTDLMIEGMISRGWSSSDCVSFLIFLKGETNETF